MQTYTKNKVFGCHEWAGTTTRDGYGVDRGRAAHRVAWERIMGAIPERMEIEHICRNRACIYIVHLTIYDRSQQERAKVWRRRAQRECPNGCDMSITAMVTPWGGRLCRVCER